MKLVWALTLALCAGCVTRPKQSLAAKELAVEELTPAEKAAWERYDAFGRKRCAAMSKLFARAQICEDGFTDWCNRELREGRSETADDCLAEYADLSEDTLPVDSLCRSKDQMDPEGCLQDALDPIRQKCAANPHGDYWACVRHHEERLVRRQQKKERDQERARQEMRDTLRDIGDKLTPPPRRTCTSRPDYMGGVVTTCQ